MTYARQMLETTTEGAAFAPAEVAAAIDACLSCQQTCTSCSNACLVEEDIANMRVCIALDEACADLCGTTARALSRPAFTDPTALEQLLRACVRECASCAEECERHAHHHRHCAICAQACRECEVACQAVLDVAPFGAS